MAVIKELMQFSAVESKLNKLLAENNLVHSFKCSGYPIVLIVSQDTDPAAQMELFSQDEGTSSRDSRLAFIFQNGDIIVRTDSRLVISDSLMSKIKGYAKKMHYLFLQAFFRKFVEENNYDASIDWPVSLPESTDDDDTEIDSQE